MLAGFLGYHIITRVPPLLHTPLMSATNAIAAISLVGSLVVAGSDYSNVPNGWVCTLLGLRSPSPAPRPTPSAASSSPIACCACSGRRSERAQKRRPVELQAFGAVVALVGRVAAILYATQARSGMAMGEYLHGHVAAEALRYCYILSAAMFVLGLKGLSSPKMGALAAWRSRRSACSSRWSARSSIPHIVTYRWIALGFVVGAVGGGTMGLQIPMTAVPQRTAFSHSLGALAACLVGVSEYFRYQGALDRVTLTALDFEVIIGALTFTGSLIAAAKLQELLPGRPITYRGQNVFSLALLSVILVSAVYLVVDRRRRRRSSTSWWCCRWSSACCW